MIRPVGHEGKVGIVTGSYPSPSETFVVNLVNGLADAGVEVEVFALTEAPRYVETARRSATPAEGGARVHDVPGRSSNRLARALAAAHLMAADGNLRRHAGPLWTLMRRGGAPMSPRTVQAASLLLNADLPAVLHCQFGQYGRLLVALRSAGLFDARIVTHFRGSDVSKAVRRSGAGYYRDLFRDGDHFLTVSEHFRARLLELGCPGDRLTVSRSGIDLSRFPPRPTGKPVGDSVRLLAIGRLVEKKGFRYAIDAVAGLRDAKARVRLDIVGEGRLRPALERQVDRLGLAGTVRLLGYRPHADIRELLTAADVFLAPSVTAGDGDAEGIPNAIKEAMATGVPVIATDHGGIPELVEDGVTGRLVPPADPAALVDRISTLVDRPAERARLVAAARSRIEEVYDRRAIAAALPPVYRRLRPVE